MRLDGDRLEIETPDEGPVVYQRAGDSLPTDRTWVPTREDPPMCNCNSPKTVHDAGPLGLPIGIPEIPIAGPLETVGLTPDPEGPPIAGPPIPWPGGEIPNISEFPVFERPKIPEWPIRRCKQNFPNGCWMLTLAPSRPSDTSSSAPFASTAGLPDRVPTG